MSKRLCSHKLMLLLVITLIARPAMSAMAHDMNMAKSGTSSVIHCHQQHPDDCNMSDDAGDDAGTHQTLNCDKCVDSCAPAVAMMPGSSHYSHMSFVHFYENSSSVLVLPRRNSESFRPPILS